MNRLGWLYTSDSPVTWIFESLARRAKHRAVLVPTEDGADLLKSPGRVRNQTAAGSRAFGISSVDRATHRVIPVPSGGGADLLKFFGPREESDCGRQWGVWDFEC